MLAMWQKMSNAINATPWATLLLLAYLRVKHVPLTIEIPLLLPQI